MRESFDIRSALVALGAVLLLLSLFLPWFSPGLEAWALFELVDVLLAGLAVTAVAALAPRAAPALRGALPWICLAALAVVLVQVVDPPPGADDAEREPGAILALVASAAMALGAVLAMARISVVVDVQARDRRRRAEAIDARGGAAGDAAAGGGGGTPLGRLFTQGDPAPPDPVTRSGTAAGTAVPSEDDLDRTEPLRSRDDPPTPGR